MAGLVAGMTHRKRRRHIVQGFKTHAIALLASLLAATAASADVPCRTSGSYDSWLAGFEREAAAQGIAQRAIAAAQPYLTYDPRIINIDRGQRVFTQTFLQFSDRMAA